MSSETNVKQTTLAQRGLLYIASGLVLIMGVILFFLSNNTETFFAWTVGVPLTAAFLGGGYLASFVLEFMAAGHRQWARSRIAVPAVFLFTSLTFIITLYHLGNFHLNSTNPITITVTWAWILVYALVPLMMGIIYIQQVRAVGIVAPRVAQLPTWFKVILGLQGGIMLLLGIAFLLIPMQVAPLWAWAQTPLTGRAIGAWLVGIGTAAIHSVLEDDWNRLRPMMAAYALYGLLQLVNLMRYPTAEGLDWALPKTWGYVFFTVSILIMGLYGVWRTYHFNSDHTRAPAQNNH